MSGTFGTNGFINGISADGKTAVGWVSPVSDNSFQIACYWTSPSGRWNAIFGPTTITDPDPFVGDFAEAFAVSGDGALIVGVVQLPAIPDGSPFVWSSGGGLVPFYTVTSDMTPGKAKAISSDGTRIAGVVNAALGLEQACVWDAVTLVATPLGYLPGHNNSQALAISSDGSVIVGWSQLGAIDLTHSLRGFRWTAGGGMVDLGLPVDVIDALTSRAVGVSGDGTLVVGGYGTLTTGGAMQWTAGGGMTQIAGLTGAGAVSGDGQTILGQQIYMAYLTGGNVIGPTPVALDPAFPTAIQITDGNAISADGLRIAGEGRPEGGSGFIPYVYLVQ